MTAAAATAEISSDERDYLDAFLAQQRVGVTMGIPSPPSKRSQLRRPKQRIEGNAAVAPAVRVSRKYRVWQRR